MVLVSKLHTGVVTKKRLFCVILEFNFCHPANAFGNQEYVVSVLGQVRTAVLMNDVSSNTLPGSELHRGLSLVKTLHARSCHGPQMPHTDENNESAKAE